MDDFIPEPLYTEMRQKFVRVCVDLLVHNGHSVLLGLRSNEPDKGQWSVFGGMLKHGETLDDCIQRKAKEELGIEVIVEHRVGVYNYVLDWQHDLCLAYLVKQKDESPIVLDTQHFEYRWFDAIEPSMTDYTKNLISDWYTMSFKPHPRQTSLHQSPHKLRLLEGTRGGAMNHK